MLQKLMSRNELETMTQIVELMEERAEHDESGRGVDGEERAGYQESDREADGEEQAGHNESDREVDGEERDGDFFRNRSINEARLSVDE